MGLRLYDMNKERLNSGIFDEHDPAITETVWTPLNKVPDDMYVIGIRGHPHNKAVVQISFLLSKMGAYEVSEELEFPEFAVYPTQEEFNKLYAP